MAYEIEELHIRKWFCSVDLEQALDTFRVVEGILQARKEAQPVVKAPRKQRSDKGRGRGRVDPSLPAQVDFIKADTFKEMSK